MSNKPLNHKDPAAPMNLEEATKYLKKVGEWESVWRLDRETMIKWANFLKNRESVKEEVPKKTKNKQNVANKIKI